MRHSLSEDFKRTYLRVSHHKSFVLGSYITFFLIAVSIASLFYTPYDPMQMNPSERFSPPQLSHPFGTDNFGRDLFSRCLSGGSIALKVGGISTLISAGFGILIGLIAGMGNIYLDEIIMRLIDGLFAFPALIFAIAIVSVLGADITYAMIAIGIVRIPVFARQVRNDVLLLKNLGFIRSAKSMGISKFQLAVKHYLPNILAPLTVLVSSNFAFSILSEAGLSYLGLGTQPPYPSWGRLLMESQIFMDKAPWLAIFPGIMIGMFVLGFTLLGDGLRDIANPRY